MEDSETPVSHHISLPAFTAISDQDHTHIIDSGATIHCTPYLNLLFNVHTTPAITLTVANSEHLDLRLAGNMRVEVRKDNARTSKLTPKGKRGVWLGFDDHSKGHYVYFGTKVNVERSLQFLMSKSQVEGELQNKNQEPLETTEENTNETPTSQEHEPEPMDVDEDETKQPDGPRRSKRIREARGLLYDEVEQNIAFFLTEFNVYYADNVGDPISFKDVLNHPQPKQCYLYLKGTCDYWLNLGSPTITSTYGFADSDDKQLCWNDWNICCYPEDRPFTEDENDRGAFILTIILLLSNNPDLVQKPLQDYLSTDTSNFVRAYMMDITWQVEPHDKDSSNVASLEMHDVDNFGESAGDGTKAALENRSKIWHEDGSKVANPAGSSKNQVARRLNSNTLRRSIRKKQVQVQQPEVSREKDLNWVPIGRGFWAWDTE
ncbi:hypothetical protein D9758_016652 [Tetrapyrgos nigripes]|uniref:Uncharacterized protein n=1 Tax=Tetrapyrgos nigripes TaxID=182062 RepID=A0A8H5FM08_9AGAR|nr:hypothetical protein D9758_016652 [Tetrapyrgos nigripes]